MGSGVAGDGATVYVLRLRAEGAGPSAVIRIRRLLKVTLRAFHLRAVEQQPVGRAETQTTVDDADREVM
jgi:hypothetical protein